MRFLNSTPGLWLGKRAKENIAYHVLDYSWFLSCRKRPLKTLPNNRFVSESNTVMFQKLSRKRPLLRYATATTLALACSRLRDGGGKSFSKKKCEKRVGLGRDRAVINPCSPTRIQKIQLKYLHVTCNYV